MRSSYAIIVAVFLASVLALSAVHALASGITWTSTNPGLSISGSQAYIVPNTAVEAKISFTLPPSSDEVIADFSGLNQGAPQISPAIQSISPTGCPNGICTRTVTLYAKSGSTQQLTFTLQPVGAAQASTESAHILFDTAAPLYGGLEIALNDASGNPTILCQRNCALRTGANLVAAHFQESGVGINSRTVAVLLPSGETATASSCTQDTCYIPAQITSTKGPISLKLAPGAADLAGNVVAATSITSQSFSIDNDPPVIGQLKLSNGIPVITGPFTVEISAKDATAITAILDVTNVVDLDATPDQQKVQMSCIASKCVATVKPRDGSYTASISVLVADSAGNTATASTTVQAAQATTDPNAFWAPVETPTNIEPQEIDLERLGLFRQQFFIPVTLQPLDSSASVAAITADACTFKINGAAITMSNEAPIVLNDADNNPVLILSIPPTQALASKTGNLDIACTVMVSSVKNGALYTKAQKITVKRTLLMQITPTMPQQITRIQLEQKLKLDSEVAHVVTLKKTYAVLSSICGILPYTDATRAGMSTSQFSLSMVPILGEVLAKVPQLARISLSAVNTAVHQTKICPIITEGLIRPSEITDAVGSALSSGKLGSTIGGATSTAGSLMDQAASLSGSPGKAADIFFDPYRSQYVAYGTLNFPAIISHQITTTQIQCSYVECLNSQVPTGVPIAMCDAQKDKQECVYTRGGLFYASPLAIWQIFRDRVIERFTNPVALVSMGVSAACEPLPATPSAICAIPLTLNQLHDSLELASKIKQTVAWLKSDSTSTFCNAPRPVVDANQIAYLSNPNCFGSLCFVKDGKDMKTKIGDSWYALTQPSSPIKNAGTPAQVPAPVSAAAQAAGGAAGQKAQQDVNKAEQLSLTPTDTPSDSVQTEWKKISDDYHAAGTPLTGGYAEQLKAYQTKIDALDSLQNQLKENPMSLEEISTAIQPGGSLYDKLTLDQRGNIQGEINAVNNPYSEPDEGVAPIDPNPDSPVNVPESKINAQLISDLGVQKVIEQNSETQVMRHALQGYPPSDATTLQKISFVSSVGQIAVEDTQMAQSLLGFSFPKNIVGWQADLDKKLAWTDLEKHFVDDACTETSQVLDNTGVVGINANQKAGLALTARRGLAISDTNQQITAGTPQTTTGKYQYIVNGMFSIDQDKNGAYALVLRDSTGATDDYSLESGSYAKSTTVSWTGASAKFYQTDNQYDQVCITFDNDLNELFTTTQQTSTTACVQIAGETS